jgi:hypothetical protein
MRHLPRVNLAVEEKEDDDKVRTRGLSSSLQREPRTSAVVSMPWTGGVRTEGGFNQILVQSDSIRLVWKVCAFKANFMHKPVPYL